MRVIRFMLAAFILAIPGPTFAQQPSPTVGSQSDPTSQRWLGGPQGTAPASLAVAERGGGEWVEFASREDRFTANFPGQPKIAETTWVSEYGASLRARIYSGERGQSRYSITVVDYNPVERILTEKAKACPAGAETCRGIADTGIGYWKNDVRGAVVYATSKLLQRPGVKLTHMMWNFMDMVAGQQLQLTNPDGSRTFASVYMHENRLLTMEGTVPAAYPEPGLFQQSLGWLDENGLSARYSFVYYNDPDLTKPALRQRTPQQRDDGRIDAPGATRGQAR